MIDISKIRIDGGTQPRIELNQDVVAEYAALYRDGVQMPAVTVFYDGSAYWLADGFHRYFGARQAGLTEICEERVPGTQRQAVLYSLGANAKHGLRRSNADKRRAVETLLADPEWATWPQAKIADACGVSREYVNRVAADSHPVIDHKIEPITVTRSGTTYEQNTANIGKVSATPAAPAQPARVEPPAAEQVARPAPAVAPIQPAPQQEQPGELESLRQQFNEVGQHLKATLDDNESMARVFDADDKLVAAVFEAARYREQNRILEERIRGLLNEKNEAIRMAKIWKRRAEKAKAELARKGS